MRRRRRVCAWVGCHQLTFETYCNLHLRDSVRSNQKVLGDRGGTGVPRDPIAHYRFRRVVLKRGICERCGRTPKRDGIKLTAHHRLALAQGGSNLPENGECLCIDCHKAVDPHYRPKAS